MEGDLRRQWSGQRRKVSIRAPAWRATRCRRGRGFLIMFLSAPPHGGRRDRCSASRALVRFYPRPRMEGDRGWASGDCSSRVSIRAPAWRARGRQWLSGYKLGVSIRAPAWRANAAGHVLTARAAFLSAPPHGGRAIPSTVRPASRWFLSAPPHGGRPCPMSAQRPTSSFYPRPRMEGDLLSLMIGY